MGKGRRVGRMEEGYSTMVLELYAQITLNLLETN